MNDLLDLIADLLESKGESNIFTGTLPAKPDQLISLFLYEGEVKHYFCITVINPKLQVRVRALTYVEANTICERVSKILDRYHDQNICVQQISPVLDIGFDSATPPRREFTANFIIRRN